MQIAVNSFSLVSIMVRRRPTAQNGCFGPIFISSVVGSARLPLGEDSGEARALRTLMLLPRARCPGKLARADPMIHRSWVVPSEGPDDPQIAEAKTLMLTRVERSEGQHSRLSCLRNQRGRFFGEDKSYQRLINISEIMVKFLFVRKDAHQCHIL